MEEQIYSDAGSYNYVPNPLPEQNDNFFLENSLFKSFEDLEKAVAAYSLKYNLTICRDTRNCTPQQFSSRFPGMQFQPCVHGGRFYCNKCSKGGKGMNRSSFKINFHYCKASRGYVISKSSSVFSCEHKIAQDLLEESALIHQENQLTQSEMEFIIEFGKYNIDSISFHSLLRTKFPDRDFERAFVKSMVRKAKQKAYGDDPHAVNKLVSLGNQVLNAGGRFQMLHSEEFTVDALFIMRADKYIFRDLYSDVLILDSTFSTSSSGLLLIPIVSIDSLGRNIILGFILSKTESSNNIIEGLKYLEFNLKGSTLVSDEAPAFSVVAEHFQMHHILCSYHYWNKVSRVSRSLGEEKKKRFEELCRVVLKDGVKCEDAEQNLNLLKQEFENESDQVKKFIQNLVGDKHKIAKAYTDKVFSAGSKSNQRSESANWSIKSSSNLYKHSLHALIEHLDIIDTESRQNAVADISECIKKKQFCSNWVLDKISAQSQEIYSCTLVSGFGNNGERKVQDSLLNKCYTVIVSTKETYEAPTCNCGFFTSCSLICKHIIVVLNDLKISPYQEKHLVNRWKLSKHPYYALAQEKVKGSVYSGSGIQKNQNRTYSNLEISDITIPHDEIERKRQLTALTQRVCNECTSDKSRFTKAVTALTNLLNETPSSSFVPVIQNKNRVRGRIPRPVNKSPLKRSTKRDRFPVSNDVVVSFHTKKQKTIP